MLPRSLWILSLIVLITGGWNFWSWTGWRPAVPFFGGASRSVHAAASLDIQFVDVIPNDFVNGRATACNIMASIGNGTPYTLDGLVVRIGERQFRFDAAAANTGYGPWNVGRVELPDTRASCADQAVAILDNVATASAPECNLDSVSEAGCRALVRVSTRMDRFAIERIRDDEMDMGQRDMRAIAVALPQEISFITEHIDDASTPNDAIVLHDTTARLLVGSGRQAGWRDVTYKQCARVAILNKGGLAHVAALMAQSSGARSSDADRELPSGLVWHAIRDGEQVWYGQIERDAIASVDFVAKCDAAAGIVALQLPHLHADGTPVVLK